jgi:hypothetical protein
MGKKAHHNRSGTRHSNISGISRLRVDPEFATVLIDASRGASVRMPDGLTGREIIEWFSLPWDEAIRRDPTFYERHLHRPVMLRSQVAGYPAGTRATVSGVQIGSQPSLTIRTPDGQLVIVGVEEVIFDDT